MAPFRGLSAFYSFKKGPFETGQEPLEVAGSNGTSRKCVSESDHLISGEKVGHAEIFVTPFDYCPFFTGHTVFSSGTELRKCGRTAEFIDEFLVEKIAFQAFNKLARIEVPGNFLVHDYHPPNR